jgi:hypothetical protein
MSEPNGLFAPRAPGFTMDFQSAAVILELMLILFGF